MHRRFLTLVAILPLLVAACAGGDGVGTSPQPAISPAATPAPPGQAARSLLAPGDELCQHVTAFGQRLADLRAVELRLPNRVALDIELDKLQAAYVELRRVDVGDSEDRLAGSLRRLGYRLGELELAVEDFRTSSRPQRASPHVEEDAQKVADELAAFVILSRC